MKSKVLSLLASSTAIAVAAALSSSAYAAPVPSSAESSRVQNQIAPLKTPKLVEDATKLQSSSSPVTAPKGAEKAHFKLVSLNIEGMTAYQEKDVQSFYQDKIGQTVSLADVYGIAEKLTAKYRNEGYVLTQVVVPPQEISGGKVKLRVVEGFVGNVTVQGNVKGDPAFMQKFADVIKAQKPLNSKVLERYLLIMNDMSGLSVRAVLSPSKTVGASDVTLVAEQKPYDLSFGVDNRGSRFLGQFQANASARLNNAFGLHEGLSLQVASAPEDWPQREMTYANLMWSQPLGHEGTTLNLGTSWTATHPGYSLEPFDVKGTAQAFNIELTHPFIRSRERNLYGSFKFNALNTKRHDNLGGAQVEDDLRVLRAGGTYQFTDSLIGINSLNVELSKGLDIFGASQKSDANKTRASGDPQFFKGTFEASRLQRITNIFDIYGAFTGQKSSNILLASEEFGLGGAAFGSAYDSSELTGEDGLAGRVELRANEPFQTPLKSLQFYGYYDLGKVWDHDNTVAKSRRASLASAGGGVRTSLNDNFSGSFEVAKPLTHPVAAWHNEDVRFFGALSAKF